MRVPGAYILCTSPRSGSTLLTRMLRDTGVAGRPASYFHGPDRGAWAKALGLDRGANLSEIVAAACAAGRAGGDLFGLRLQGHSLGAFREALVELSPAGGDAARIAALFGPTRFLYLRREDKLAQAVSLVIAEQSGLWHRRSDGSELERLSAPATPAYDEGAIAAQIATFEQMDAAWEAWFAQAGFDPMRLTYEHLAADPSGSLGQVLTWIGRDPSLAVGVAPSVQRLADATSAAWIARYRAGQL